MKTSEMYLNYNRIEKAIAFIQANFKKQPSLEEIAAHVHLSPFHFQRLFQEWAGTTPKKFLQYISLQHAKHLLKETQSIAEATYMTGLSSSSRLHDLFVKVESMTPAEYKNGGVKLTIYYSTHLSPFGPICIASTEKGICHIAFVDPEKALSNIREQYPLANVIRKELPRHIEVLHIFDDSAQLKNPLHLHLKGTPFQLKVWEALLKVPKGCLTTYAHLAEAIGHPKASRAVGTAIGSNPIAYLIPCHRVIQSSGIFGGYMWGPIRKAAIIGWEQAQVKDITDETF